MFDLAEVSVAERVDVTQLIDVYASHGTQVIAEFKAVEGLGRRRG